METKHMTAELRQAVMLQINRKLFTQGLITQPLYEAAVQEILGGNKTKKPPA